jgi:hypothetical protein
MIKEYEGLNSIRKGKGGAKSLRKGAKLEGLLPKEYYNIIPKYYGKDNYFILSYFGKGNESQVERNELLEIHVSSREHANKCGGN